MTGAAGQQPHTHTHGEPAGHGGHHHHHAPEEYDRAFAIGIALNVAFVAVEGFYGFSTRSLALLADAGHNLGDVLGLAVAWGAVWLARRPASRRRTYGLGRGTILAALINASTLLIAVGAIAVEAIRRLAQPEAVAGATVMGVAAIGIVINAVTAALFRAGRTQDLNIRGAFLHMAADAAISLGVLLAAALWTWQGWLWLDPALSLAIGVIIAVGTWELFRDALNLALDAVPRTIDRTAVERFLAEVPGVTAVHDLHIWPLSTTSVALTAHLVRPAADSTDELLHWLEDELRRRFGIDHTTIQCEQGNGGPPCRWEVAHQGGAGRFSRDQADSSLQC
jgi:cobalt-zinc-cadmium efflux system protein